MWTFLSETNAPVRPPASAAGARQLTILYCSGRKGKADMSFFSFARLRPDGQCDERRQAIGALRRHQGCAPGRLAVHPEGEPESSLVGQELHVDGAGRLDPALVGQEVLREVGQKDVADRADRG